MNGLTNSLEDIDGSIIILNSAILIFERSIVYLLTYAIFLLLTNSYSEINDREGSERDRDRAVR